MHFVISMFVAIVCLASLIIFKEILNKIISFIIGVIGCAGFAYAMAMPYGSGHLVSARVEASIAGADSTYLEHRSFHTGDSGEEVGVEIGSPSVNDGGTTTVTFTKDTVASTLRYYYMIPEEARGKQVSFRFSVTDSNGDEVSYDMGPYSIENMDMKCLIYMNMQNTDILKIELMGRKSGIEII